MSEVKVTERGWAGHFICANKCLFRRNTLIEGEYDSVIVSTIGGMINGKNNIDTIGAFGRYYETMVFGVEQQGLYIDANVSDQRDMESEWQISAKSVNELPEGVDNLANDMHETAVNEFIKKLREES